MKKTLLGRRGPPINYNECLLIQGSIKKYVYELFEEAIMSNGWEIIEKSNHLEHCIMKKIVDEELWQTSGIPSRGEGTLGVAENLEVVERIKTEGQGTSGRGCLSIYP